MFSVEMVSSRLEHPVKQSLEILETFFGIWRAVSSLQPLNT